MNTPTKTCYICKQDFPATPKHFHRDKTRADGLHPYCKSCRSEKRRKRYESRPDLRKKARQRANEWFYDNRERARRYRKKQYRENREYYIRKAREWREENPEQYRENMRRYKHRHYRENREEYNAWVRNRRARLQDAEGSHSADDIRQLYDEQDGKCEYCGESIAEEYHVDHVIPLSRGGSNNPDNLALTCPTCNMSKNDRLPSEWNPITD